MIFVQSAGIKNRDVSEVENKKEIAMVMIIEGILINSKQASVTAIFLIAHDKQLSYRLSTKKAVLSDSPS